MNPAGGKTEEPKRPDHVVWDLLAASFGEPRTKTERSMFGKVVRELLEAGATPEEVEKTCAYVLGRFDNPSVMSIPKWFSVSQKQGPQMSPQQAEIAKLRMVE